MDDFDTSDVSALALEMANLKLELEQTKRRIAELERDYDRFAWNTASTLREFDLVLKHLGSKSE